MDKRIQRKLKHIREELDSDNVKLILEYFDAMKLDQDRIISKDKESAYNFPQQ